MNLATVVYQLAGLAGFVTVVAGLVVGVRLLRSSWTGRLGIYAVGTSDLLAVARDARAVMVAFLLVLLVLVGDTQDVAGMTRLDAASQVCLSYAQQLVPTMALVLVADVLCTLRHNDNSILRDQRTSARQLATWGVGIALAAAYLLGNI